ncbi:hypothetical protein CsSME_00021565 [Camellia sinensis var. sinensis]
MHTKNHMQATRERGKKKKRRRVMQIKDLSRYAGNAKLGCDHCGGSITKQGSDFSKSATYIQTEINNSKIVRMFYIKPQDEILEEEKVDCICFVPSGCRLGNSDIYARGNPLKGKESKLQAS